MRQYRRLNKVELQAGKSYKLKAIKASRDSAPDRNSSHLSSLFVFPSTEPSDDSKRGFDDLPAFKLSTQFELRDELLIEYNAVPAE